MFNFIGKFQRIQTGAIQFVYKGYHGNMATFADLKELQGLSLNALGCV